MGVGFCEKDCAVCALKEELSCPGCQMGPGNEMYGTCGIAKCCRKQGLDSCGACEKKVGCTELAVKDLLAQRRKTQHELRQSKDAVMGTRAPFMRKCLWALFWLSLVPGFLPNFFATEDTRQYTALLCVDEVFNLAAAVIIIAMTREEREYQLPGCILAGLAVHDFLMNMFTVSGEPPLWAVFTSMLTPYAAIAAMWLLFGVHAEAAADVDKALTGKWEKLRIWAAFALLVIELTNYFMIFAPVVFVQVGAVAAIVFAVTEIIELVYLAKMAKGYKKL